MNIEILKENGIDYDEGLRRFSGYTEIYEKYLRRLADLDIYKELEEKYTQKDVKGAFEASHKLKAFIGNLSIPVLFDEISKMTEILRLGTMGGTEESMAFITEGISKLATVMQREIEKET
ncbi:MAG: hypothetical protein PHE02_12475 [Lachnospiraceae bacterium]|nr:hypothetical protein [Lachnospiraceae bacterium]